MEDSKFRLAVSVLDALVGLRFAALQSAQKEMPRIEGKVSGLKTAFQNACNMRDELHNKSETELEKIIEEIAPLVNTKRNELLA